MAFSGGTFSRTFDCTTDRDNGVKILASKFDTELDGMATGLSTCILKDGTQTCTAAIPFAQGITLPDNKTIILGTNSDVTIQYDVRRLEHVISGVEMGSVDIGFGLGLGAHPAIDVTVLRTDKMVVLIPKGHALSGASVISAMDCFEHGHIGLDGAGRFGMVLRRVFEEKGVPYTPRVSVRYCHTAAVLANAGIGVAIVDHYTPALIANMDLEVRNFE